MLSFLQLVQEKECHTVDIHLSPFVSHPVKTIVNVKNSNIAKEIRNPKNIHG